MESPQNWLEISSDVGEASQIIFGSDQSSSSKIYPMDKDPNTTTAPDAMFIKYKPGTSEEKFLKIANWSRLSPGGFFVLAVRFQSPFSDNEYDPVSILGYPRIEAYDSEDSLDKYLPPSKELLVGTKSETMPLLRAIDLTAEASGLNPSSGWPPSNWWYSATYGQDRNRIKALHATLSYLECNTVIVPEGGTAYVDDSGSAYTGASSSDTFYFSLCPIIPSDSFRGMRGHDVVVTCRAHFL